MFVFALAWSSQSFLTAATVTVTTTNDNGAGSLRQAVQTAVNGDSINFSVSGTITTAYRNIRRSWANNGNVVRYQQFAVGERFQSRVFEIGTNAIVRISGLTIRDGHAADFVGGSNANGGGIYNSGSLTLSNCAVLNNRSGNGAGGNMFSRAGNPGGVGGGLYNAGTLTLTYCVLNGNVGGYGGSGYGYYSSGNGGPGGPGGAGGGIYNSGQLSAYASTVSSNLAGGGASGGFGDPGSGGPGGPGGDGGGLFNIGTATFTNCTFSANRGGAGGAGSGCYVGNGGNGAGGGNGGGLFNSGTFDLVACTLSANSGGIGGDGGWESGTNLFGTVGYGGSGGSGGTGGGIYNATVASSAKLRNTLVAGNNAAPGGAAGTGTLGNGSPGTGGAAPDFAGAYADLGHNLVSGNPVLAPLADNGGLTPTMAVLPGSPAVDAGDDALLSAPFNLGSDQRGVARKSGAHTDIGAVELQQLVLTRVAQSGNNVLVSFSSEIGQKYRIERADNVPAATWTTVADNVAGTGSSVQVIDMGGASRPQRFYRGRVLP